MRYILPFLCFCGVTISLLVFLSSTQPFVLTQIFKVSRNGTASGMLALVDEVVAIILAPLWGALSDKIGTRYVAIVGLWIITSGLFLYPRVSAVIPYLLIARGVFSVGASASASMIPAALSELSLLAPRNFTVSRSSTPEPSEQENGADDNVGDRTVPLFESSSFQFDPNDDIAPEIPSTPRRNGKLAGMTGFSSGLGAILAVSLLLPLPTKLGKDPVRGLILAFNWVCSYALLASLILFVLMYQNPARGIRSWLQGSANVSIFDEAAMDAGGSVVSYFELLKDGFLAARDDHRLAVAYLGSLVSRAANVCLSLFIPLWVNQWYYETGRCNIDDSEGCRDAIVQAAILTGLANTVLLLAAPLVGWAGDSYGSVSVLSWSAGVGLVSMIGYLMINKPLGFTPILISCLFGLAQIGCLTMSLSMSTDRQRICQGSVSGVFSLAGSLGILTLTQVGGPLADIWLKAPFLIMAFVFLTLVVVCYSLASHTTVRPVRSTTSL